MTLLAPGAGRRRPTEQEAISVELVSGLLMIIGFIAFAYLFYGIVTDPVIREAVQGPAIPGVGLSINVTEDAEGTPYFRMEAIEGGPAAEIGIQTGDRLVSIDGEDITGWNLGQVQTRLAEADVSPTQDDFTITLGFLRERPDGELREQERDVSKNVAPTLLVAYLQSFGFVLPALLISLGIGFFMLGTRLRRYDIVAARWTLVALLWMIIGLVVAAVWAAWVQGKGGIVTEQPFDFGKAITSAIPFLVAIIPLAAAYYWLKGTIDELFRGDETLTSRNTRFAWSLLIPTLAALIFVAARPLEQTFIKSLTDDEFGTDRPVRFVGLDNYRRLLDFQFTVVECRRNDDGTCRVSRNGTIQWQASEVEEAERGAEGRGVAGQVYHAYEDAGTLAISSDRGIRILGRDPVFLQSFGNTIQFAVVSVVLETLIGLIIAMVVNSNFKGRGLMRAAMLVPWSIPTVVSAALWLAIMRPDQTGILNKLLLDLGLISGPVQWLASSGPWMGSLIAVDVWKTTPFMALLLLAGLQTIPGDIYEAADVDGASKVRQFFSLTLPLLRPTIAVALIFRTLDALRAFDVFSVLLQSDPTRPSLATYNYNVLVSQSADGYASAVGVMIFILIFVFVIGYMRLVGMSQK